MKLYLSGPMSGHPDNNSKAFASLAATLRGYGYNVVVPHELDESDTHKRETWGSFLGRDVQMIADKGIDGLVLLHGWQASKGAKLEITLALILGLKIYKLALEHGDAVLERVTDIRDQLMEVL